MATTDTPVPQVWPQWAGRRPERRRLAVIATAMLASLAGIDAAVHAATLARVRQEFEMSATMATVASGLGWLVAVALVAGLGAGGDRSGRRRMLLLGGSTVGIGCLITVFATNQGVFLAGRAVTGLGIAAIVVTALAVLPGLFFPGQLPAVIGVWLALQSAAVLVGGLAAGAFVAEIGWRTGYVLTAAVAFVALGPGRLLIPDTVRVEGERGRVDLVGVVLAGTAPAVLFGGLGCLVVAGWRSPVVPGAVGVAIVLVAAFVVWERCRPDPVLAVRLLRATPFSAAWLAQAGCAMAVVVYLLPAVALLRNPAEPVVTALVLPIPMFLGMIIGAVSSGSGRRHQVPLRVFVVSGLVCCACGALLGASVDVREQVWLYATIGTVVGFGVMWTATAHTTVLVAATAPQRSGAGAAVSATAGLIGLVVGSVALGSAVVVGGGVADDAFFRGFPAALRGAASVLGGVALAIWLLLYRHRARTPVEAVAYCRYRATQSRRAESRPPAPVRQ